MYIHILLTNCLQQKIVEGKIKGEIEVTWRWGIRRRKLLDDLKEKRGYSHLKEEDLDRTMWRARFGRGFGTVVRETTKWIYIYTVYILYIRLLTCMNFDIYLENWGRDLMHNYQNTKGHNSSFRILQCKDMQQFLYCTVTREKAQKHIVASTNRKWPHRETFRTSSRYCMNLWVRGTHSVQWKY
jgi:hypothetical protein